jgi:hypothetical protein
MLSLLMATPLSASAESLLEKIINTPRYSWIAGGYSQSVQESGERGLVVSGGRMPVDSGIGYQAYLEGTKLNEPDDTNMVYTLGVEQIFKWRWAYIGLGLAVSDRRTAVSGTYWNFRQRLGIRYKAKKKKWFLDLGLTHGSHCARCGIEEDKVNTGQTALVFQFGKEF